MDEIISIHAPPRGATGIATENIEAFTKFQFTPLREGRRTPRAQTRTRMYFNSRPSARGDKAAREALEGMNKFQFTPLREGRRRATRRCCSR